MYNNRREFITTVAGSFASYIINDKLITHKENSSEFTLNYLLASCLYGYMDLEIILPEVQKIGAIGIDVWPKVHGNQREQIDRMGIKAFLLALKRSKVDLKCITQYKLGPFNLKDEMRFGSKLGCELIITGGSGPKGLKGHALKSAVKNFVEKMKSQIEVAEKTGIKIAIENHANSLIESTDSLKWLLEYSKSDYLGIALAPYHLQQDEKLLSGLIKDLGSGIFLFYAWQHGMGSTIEQSKESELMQLPGRGPMNFKPLLAALKDINYQGYTEIFMHSFPRGTPMLKTSEAITKEINHSRKYLDKCLKEI